MSFLKGEKISLRSLKKEDLHGPYFDWLNDQDVTRFMESGKFPNSEENMMNFYNNIVNSRDNILLAIVTNHENKHIGNIKLGSINWIHRRAEIGIMIGDKTEQGKGYAAEAIKLLLDHAFSKLNLRKIILGVISENTAAVKLYQKIGFKTEGTAREEMYYDGKYHDMIYMGILKCEYQGCD